MTETRTLLVPQLALNYDGNVLGSVGIGGELYVRDTPLIAENAVLKAENAKLRELVRELYEDQCIDGDRWKYRDRMRELGVEVDE